MYIQAFLKNLFLRLWPKSNLIETFTLGFCFDHVKSQYILPSLDWFDPEETRLTLLTILENFCEKYRRDCAVSLFKPALVYYLWKHIYWPEKYFAAALAKKAEYNATVFGGSRLSAYCNPPRISNILNMVALIYNLLICLSRRNIILTYSIGSVDIANSSSLCGITFPDNTDIINAREITLRNLWKSLSTLTPSYFLFKHSCSPLLPVDKRLHRYARFLWLEYLFHKLVLSSRVSLFVSHDDPSRVFSLLRYCQEANIKTVGIQHGLYSRYEFGYSPLSDNISCTSDKWFEDLHVSDPISATILKMLISPSSTTTIIEQTAKPESSILFTTKIRHDLANLSLFPFCTVVLDSYADIDSLRLFFDNCGDAFPNTKFFLRPHPSMKDREIFLIQSIPGFNIPISTSLPRNHAYLILKSTLTLFLLREGYDVFCLPSRLAFTDDVLLQLSHEI
jgi:hypothetical protein